MYPPKDADDEDDADDVELSQCRMFNISEVDWAQGDYDDWVQLNRTYYDCPQGWTYSKEYYESTIVSEVL